ncbi:MAG: 2-oxo-4-hydroxy-4-carboxy-5-ureidoimidazoline decarboxylase [Pseudomonadota bacterium]|jgi:N-carbamoyl-L-amino-acid hydrolase
MSTTVGFDAFRQMPVDVALEYLAGVYEHSDWIVEKALEAHPHVSLPALLFALQQVVDMASVEQQLRLIRAHPPLTGKAKIGQDLARDSQNEQSLVGLDRCSPDEYAALTRLHGQYEARFGWPFILAVRGPRGTGLSRQEIIQTWERRLLDSEASELQECLRQIHRIAEMRLYERFGMQTIDGDRVWDDCQRLAAHSETSDGLTVTFLSPAHQACADSLVKLFREAGCDEVARDAIGNVVGRYFGNQAASGPFLLTGSHYDTVRRGGRYDGRLGIVVPLQVVRGLSAAGRRLPFGIEIVGFSEEEGVRYSSTFLGSSALTGSFQAGWLDMVDAGGTALREALANAGLASEAEQINVLARDPARYLGFVEVHIEQGPVLNQKGIALGVVTAINGSLRYRLRLHGQASHAGTTPMGQRRDAACAAAEIILATETRARSVPGLVGTVGMLQVPQGSINTVPGLCELSLDLRAPNNEDRDALARDVLSTVASVCQARDVQFSVEEVLRASAAPCDARLQGLWAGAVGALGLPVEYLPSGAGHDAMKLHERLPQGMLFVRGENRGISHNPLESTTREDMQLAVDAFRGFCEALSLEG